MTVNPMLDAALHYATAHKWPVFPLAPRKKTPLIAKRDGGHGFHDATTDPEQIRACWGRWPTANIGARAGVVFDVFDIDAWPPGGLSFDGTSHRLGNRPLACGPSVTTANDHLQLYFASPHHRPIPGRVRFIDGCDWRGVGSYAVAPPSVGPNGQRYGWRTDCCVPLEPVDEWLLDLLDPPRPAPAPRTNTTPGARTGSYALAALEQEARAVAATPEGQRNHQLNTAAFNLGTLIGAGQLDRATVEHVLEIAAHDCGLDHREAAGTITSGLDAGIAQPRQVA